VCLVTFVVCICYTHCIVMTCYEIKFSKTCVYSLFVLSLFLTVTLDKHMTAIHIIMIISCCDEWLTQKQYKGNVLPSIIYYCHIFKTKNSFIGSFL